MAQGLDLDALFAEARQLDAAPSDDLFARVLADAGALQPAPAVFAAPQGAAAPTRRGFWLALAGLFGGGGAIAGIGTAMMAGLLIGVFQPAPVSALTTALFDGSAVSVELMPDYDTLMQEVVSDE